MGKSIEQQAKVAFDKWDETKINTGFDKEAVWQQLAGESTGKLSFGFLWKVAAVLVIMLLSSVVVALLWQNKELKRKQLAQMAIKEKVSFEVKEPVQKPEKSIEVRYKTHIKEVTPPEVLNKLNHLKLAIAAAKDEQEKLKVEKEDFRVLSELYKDSVKSIIQLNTELLMMVDQLREVKRGGSVDPLDIEINEEALLALSTERKPEANLESPVAKMNIGLKLNRNVNETTAPIFGDNYSK